MIANASAMLKRIDPDHLRESIDPVKTSASHEATMLARSVQVQVKSQPLELQESQPPASPMLFSSQRKGMNLPTVMSAKNEDEGIDVAKEMTLKIHKKLSLQWIADLRKLLCRLTIQPIVIADMALPDLKNLVKTRRKNTPDVAVAGSLTGNVKILTHLQMALDSHHLTPTLLIET